MSKVEMQEELKQYRISVEKLSKEKKEILQQNFYFLFFEKSVTPDLPNSGLNPVFDIHKDHIKLIFARCLVIEGGLLVSQRVAARVQNMKLSTKPVGKVAGQWSAETAS